MTRPLQLIPIPFIDLTLNAESVLPATPVAITTDLVRFPLGLCGSLLGSDWQFHRRAFDDGD
jgi:hypothetical protein